ncbi:hypothetical protein VNO80_07478 [Phaseolus coccineus]|uniref:Secreted protein n=1 Tax=Phaseolus coccineus TaxID=3886 RepID=A0AAN9NNS4_PHACN
MLNFVLSLSLSSYLVSLSSSRIVSLSLSLYLYLLTHTEQPATEAPTRIGRLDTSSEHFHVPQPQSHFAPILTDFHLLVFTIDAESV